jgi:hypothetical protein
MFLLILLNYIKLYKLYTVPGTYYISVKPIIDGSEVATSNIIPYAIDQLEPHGYFLIYPRFDWLDSGTVIAFSGNLNFSSECTTIDGNGNFSNCSNKKFVLDPRATNLEAKVNANCDSGTGYPKPSFLSQSYAYNYSGLIKDFNQTYTVNSCDFFKSSKLYYNADSKDFNDVNETEFIFKLSAPGYIDSNYILGDIKFTCLSPDTEILVYDEKKKKLNKKKIKDITYDDLLLVWDFDNCKFTYAKPLWIKQKQTSPNYNLLKFSDGTILKTINQHRIFNKQLGKFTYPMYDETPIGTEVFNSEGKLVKLISKEVIHEKTDYYNIITDYYIDFFANGLLTSCRYSNLYPIKDMKYVKDNRKLNKREDFNVSDKWFKGLRLAEQDKDINKNGNYFVGHDIEEHIKLLEDLDIKNRGGKNG